MVARDASHDPHSSPSRPVDKGYATLSTLRVGVKAYIEKAGEKRKAEILSIQQRKGLPTFYVHYEDFNKRLDEWIAAERIDLSQEVEWPAPDKADTKKDKSKDNKTGTTTLAETTSKVSKSLKRSRSTFEHEPSGPDTPDSSFSAYPGKAARPARAGGKENRNGGAAATGDSIVVSSEVLDGTPQPEDEHLDLSDVQDAAAAAKAAPASLYSREDEIEKLRTSGSMTQNQTEISRVRNLSRIQMGAHEMEPWYFSPYPAGFSDADMVYICEFCLEYYDAETSFRRHRAKCALVHPPGNEIYRDAKLSFFEVDGRRQRTWCRNLCLLSKLFLDHKTLYYDVDPFLFYCMCTRDAHGCHLVGYFSKEKESADGYNVACILTLPQYQRQGFGRLLIAFSYELSKRENKLGSPEKPLSDLGLLGYRAYWQETIVDLLMSGRTEANIEELGNVTAMTTNDVLHTLQNLNMLRFAKNQHVIVLTDAVVAQRERQLEKEKIKGKHHIDSEKLIWKPPVFTASSRTWNW